VGKEWNDIAFRILFTKLLSGESPHYRVLFGYESTLNFNLWFTGANNIYDKFHKEWVEFQQTTKLVKIERIFELKEIIELDFSKKILIDGNMYLIRRIQVTINKGQMFKANMECLTVK